MKRNVLIIGLCCLLVIGIGVFALTKGKNQTDPVNSGDNASSVKEEEDGTTVTSGKDDNGTGSDTATAEGKDKGSITPEPTTNPDTELPEVEIPINEDTDEEIEYTGEEQTQESEEDSESDGNDEVIVEDNGDIILPEIP